ncbi:hypothetical protein [Streptomyces natalensis]|uniref:Uncharacterized protein n=1 Tax=Streptomyces natalensis ATCC 27448 TaxID=1240678 RepID=A0A0D7CLU9_9ACTN|nr:hypothetical protein [Streptomyces natalensis]KIZ16815.1 hypothetical protein SNA_17590 [Streptomyces natalensis ATCC 27448]
MKRSDPVYLDAVDAAARIVRERARERRTIKYGELSAALRQDGYDVSPHGDVMRYLLADVSRLDNPDGRLPMLSALVVTQGFGVPAEGFYELAAQPPFSRGRQGGRMWENERDAVWKAHNA